MVRYAYNRQVNPPAPFIYVRLRCPDTGKELDNLPAQVDTAADRTIVPRRWVDELEIYQLDVIPLEGYGGHISEIPTFVVQISIHDLLPLLVEIAGDPVEPYILLGRDVLNQFRFLLDGPGQFLEIG